MRRLARAAALVLLCGAAPAASAADRPFSIATQNLADVQSVADSAGRIHVLMQGAKEGLFSGDSNFQYCRIAPGGRKCDVSLAFTAPPPAKGIFNDGSLALSPGGTVYVLFNYSPEFGDGEDVQGFVSDNGGASFTALPATRVRCPILAVGPGEQSLAGVCERHSPPKGQPGFGWQFTTSPVGATTVPPVAVIGPAVRRGRTRSRRLPHRPGIRR